MVHSSLLNFDPFAVHPFTNIASQPMPYPIPIPAAPTPRDYYPTSTSPGSASSSPSSVSTQDSIVLHSPSPRRRADVPATQPIFVPYRREASTPELVLKKKSPSQTIGGYPAQPSKA